MIATCDMERDHVCLHLRDSKQVENAPWAFSGCSKLHQQNWWSWIIDLLGLNAQPLASQVTLNYKLHLVHLHSENRFFTIFQSCTSFLTISINHTLLYFAVSFVQSLISPCLPQSHLQDQGKSRTSFSWLVVRNTGTSTPLFLLTPTLLRMHVKLSNLIWEIISTRDTENFPLT